ncbi:MAG: hypothetical protein KBE25_03700 [Laribacter sp.]|nr:hypothetical protein [Laribacter sp.]MBP9528227.1 hypothetical protein [Laribacter sp.]MBP9608437.1 hypothetical protein [Laribacter sp.]
MGDTPDKRKGAILRCGCRSGIRYLFGRNGMGKPARLAAGMKPEAEAGVLEKALANPEADA